MCAMTAGHGSEDDNSHVFLVRVWATETAEGRSEWHGKAQHVLSGEANYLPDLSRLPDVMIGMLPPDITAHEEQHSHARPDYDPPVAAG